MTFPTITAALRFWTDRDPSPLNEAIAPPCDALGDEVYDVALARIFAALVPIDSLIGRIGRIQITIDVNQPQLEHIRRIDREYQPEAAAAGHRIERMLAVLDAWKTQILEDADHQSTERAA